MCYEWASETLSRARGTLGALLSPPLDLLTLWSGNRTDTEWEVRTPVAWEGSAMLSLQVDGSGRDGGARSHSSMGRW